MILDARFDKVTNNMQESLLDKIKADGIKGIFRPAKVWYETSEFSITSTTGLRPEQPSTQEDPYRTIADEGGFRIPVSDPRHPKHIEWLNRYEPY